MKFTSGPMQPDTTNLDPYVRIFVELLYHEALKLETGCSSHAVPEPLIVFRGSVMSSPMSKLSL
jgi:hypothetical protein